MAGRHTEIHRGRVTLRDRQNERDTEIKKNKKPGKQGNKDKGING